MQKKQRKRINKKVKASKMFIGGMLPGTICQKLCLDKDMFWEYLEEYQYDEAIKMKVVGVPNETICKKLKLPKEMLLRDPLKMYFSEKKVNKRKNGRSSLVDEIYWEYRVKKRLELKV